MRDRQLEKARRMFDYAIAVVIGITIGFLTSMLVMHILK